MGRCPESVLVVGILLCLSGVFSTFYALYHFPGNDLMPVWASDEQLIRYYVVGYGTFVASILTLLCGIYTIKGANWARWLYLGVCVLTMSFDFFYTDAPNWVAILVWQLFFSIAFVAILFLPNANTFFSADRRHRW
jgi:hypothetical protein